MRSLVIFDLDGTLVNSVADLADSVNTALRELGLPTHPLESYYDFVGNGTIKLCERALPQESRSEENILLLHKMFADNYSRFCLNHTAPYDGIREVLDRIRSAGIKSAVASNKTEVFTRQVIDSLFKPGTFEYVAGKREGTPLKPDPYIVREIMRIVGAKREDCIYVGDSQVDVMTAHNAGLECIGCTWGFRGESELRSAGAEYIAYKPEDIAAFLGI